MSVKFTTGSWIKEESLTPDGRGTGTYNVYQNSEDGQWVAFTGTAHDARLIEAAPDLLAALQSVADYWAGGDVPKDIDAAMRLAIAKATGVQS